MSARVHTLAAARAWAICLRLADDPPAARQKYGSPSHVIAVVSRDGSYSSAPARAQSQFLPVRGSVQTYVWWSEGQVCAAWQPDRCEGRLPAEVTATANPPHAI